MEELGFRNAGISRGIASNTREVKCLHDVLDRALFEIVEVGTGCEIMVHLADTRNLALDSEISFFGNCELAMRMASFDGTQITQHRPALPIWKTAWTLNGFDLKRKASAGTPSSRIR